MRAVPWVICAVVLAGVVPAGAQQKPPETDKLPEKGDSVLVTGCLNGSTLASIETVATDSTGKYGGPLNYQLRGKKELLKKLRAEHDGHVVEVIGTLKSSLQGIQMRAKQLGKSRVFIGVGQTADTRHPVDRGEEQPVLDVQSYEGTPTVCGR